MLLKHGLLENGQVIVLQPRRLAARLLAARVAQELGVQLGREVGYQIRFENVSSAATKIKFVTEGILLRQMIQDPRLRGVSAVIFDEFHERHLYGDISLARALDLQENERRDLLLAVMSATLNQNLLQNFLKPCTVLESQGRTFPVDIEFAHRASHSTDLPVWEQAADAFSDYVGKGGEGDVLIFMPGGFEISQTIEAVRHRSEARGFILLPLHGELPPRDQDAAVARYSQRKVVVATNVAETSLTIDGVRLVIDSGLARIPKYDPYRGINTLLVEKISRASSDQRAGRAGRTAPGTCMRLWTDREHAERAAQELPEIKRLDLAEVVLTLKSAGIRDLKNFRWLEPPDEKSLAQAEQLLCDLGALKKGGRESSRAETSSENESQGSSGASPSHSEITEIGRKMLAFPLHPRYARMLLAAEKYKCVYQACLIAALTQGRDLLLRKVDKQTEQSREDILGEKASSDFWILMRAWNYAAQNDFRVDACRKLGIHALTAKQVGPMLDQFLRIAERERLDVQPREIRDEDLQKCILSGFSDHVSRRLDKGTLRCEMVHGRRGVLARESVVQQSELFVTAEVREIGGREGDVNTIFSLATAIQPEWLGEIFPDDISGKLRVFYDATTKRVYAGEQQYFRDLTLAERRVEPPPLDESAKLLAEEVVEKRLTLTEWDHSVEQWILRLGLLNELCPDLQLPALTEEDRHHLIEQICHGAFTYKEIKDRPVKPVVKSWLSPAQQQLLEKHVPERIDLGNGRTPKISYSEDGAPYIAVRIQELFGVTQTPKIAMGRLSLAVHILAPNMRPVQITQDLANFWREQYPKVKQELQRKYPKHEWR